MNQLEVETTEHINIFPRISALYIAICQASFRNKTCTACNIWVTCMLTLLSIARGRVSFLQLLNHQTR
jgi:hypothetical protein